MAEAPKPGIYPDVMFEEYYAWEAANASLLKRIHSKTPLHARHEQIQPHVPSPAMQLGDAIHACILEPDRFEEQFARGLELPRRKKADQEAHAAHELENKDKVILAPKDYDVCLEMRDRAIHSTTDVAELLLAEGSTEVSIVWDDEKTGVRCKARIDKFTMFGPWPVLVDLKSTRDASAESFRRDCARFGYHIQAAFYLDGANTLAPRDRNFLFIAMEKEAPYAAQIFELGPDSLRSGRIAYRVALQQWARCLESNTYPAYPDSVTTIDVPAWAIDLDESLVEGGIDDE